MLIVLIHNNETDMPSRLVADNLMSMIPGVNVFEVFEQNEFSKTTNLSKLFQHLKMQLRIENLWREYRGKQSLISQLKAAVNFVRKVILLLLVPTFRKREWRIREIESAVSLKHQTAWRIFRESKAEILLVLESDAAWIENESSEIPSLLELSFHATPVYLNLAGGLNLDVLGVDSLTETTDETLLQNTKRFSKPITNTSCAYAINHSLVDALLSHTENFSSQRSLGIDWLINGVFLEMTRRQEKVDCVHSYPPILYHGSMTGISNSWHPGRD